MIRLPPPSKRRDETHVHGRKVLRSVEDSLVKLHVPITLGFLLRGGAANT